MELGGTKNNWGGQVIFKELGGLTKQMLKVFNIDMPNVSRVTHFSPARHTSRPVRGRVLIKKIIWEGLKLPFGGVETFCFI